MPTKVPTRIVPDSPKWHEKLIDRCRNHVALADFPSADVAERFSSRDANGRDLPADELVDFVLQRFAENSHAANKPLESAVEGAEKMIRLALENHAPALSSLELAKLKAAEAHLLKRLAYGADGHLLDQARASAAAEIFQQAGQLLNADGPPSKLRRHYFWLAADILTQSRSAQELEPTIALLIREALTGHPQWATAGLYYNCASRLFRLDHEAIEHVLQAVANDLLRAWSRVPAGVEIPKPEQEETQSAAPGLVNLGFVLTPEQQAKLGIVENHPPRIEEVTVSLDQSRLHWQPADRFGLCVMLHRGFSHGPLADLFLGEANKFLHGDFGLSQEPNAVGLLAYLDKLPVPQNVQFHEDIKCDTVNKLAELLRTGHVKEAVRVGKESLASTANPTEFGQVAMYVALALGDAVSAEEEGELLNAAIAQLGNAKSVGEAFMRSQLHRAKARHLWHTVGGESALAEIETGLDWAARAGSLHVAIQCQKMQYEIRLQLGRPNSPKILNGFIRSAVHLWGKMEWTGYLVEKSRLTFDDDFALGPKGTTGLRELRQLVFGKAWERASEEEIRQFSFKLKQHTGADEPLVLAEVWEEFFLRVRSADNLRRKRGEEGFSFDLTVGLAKQLAELCSATIATLRCAGTLTKNAMILGEWLVSQRETIPVHVREAIAGCIRNAVDSQIRQFKQTKLKANCIGIRANLAKLVGLLTGIVGATGLQTTECLRWLDYCKSMDADDEPDELEQSHKNTPGAAAELADQEANDAVEPTQDSEINFDALVKRLDEEDAALVDIFLCPRDGCSFALILGHGEAQIIPLAITGEWLKQHYKKPLLRIGRKILRLPPELPLSVPKALTTLRDELKAVASAGFVAEADKIFAEVGKQLLPRPLIEAVKNSRRIYVVPHSMLFGLPLHLLPSEDSSRLMDSHEVLFLPKTRYLEVAVARPERAVDGDWICANVEDGRLGEQAKELANLYPQIVNRWFESASSHSLLESLARRRRVCFYVHGYHTWRQPWLTRLALRNGIRLTAGHVRDATASFSETEIELFACHSAHPEIRHGSEMLGIASAFLAKRAASVLACLWPPTARDALKLAREMAGLRGQGASNSVSFSGGLRASTKGMPALESALRFGCFVLYGR